VTSLKGAVVFLAPLSAGNMHQHGIVIIKLMPTLAAREHGDGEPNWKEEASYGATYAFT
jgi:hypothetical protein